MITAHSWVASISFPSLLELTLQEIFKEFFQSQFLFYQFHITDPWQDRTGRRYGEIYVICTYLFKNIVSPAGTSDITGCLSGKILFSGIPYLSQKKTFQTLLKVPIDNIDVVAPISFWACKLGNPTIPFAPGIWAPNALFRIEIALVLIADTFNGLNKLPECKQLIWLKYLHEWIFSFLLCISFITKCLKMSVSVFLLRIMTSGTVHLIISMSNGYNEV